MKIMHVTQPGEAGVARVVVELAARQAASGLDVVVAGPDDTWLSRELELRGLRLLAWNAKRTPSLSTRREIGDLASMIISEAPSVLHLHSTKAGLVGRLAAKGRVPTVFQPHAWGDWAAPGSYRWLVRGWERIAGRWSTLTLCLSDDELKHADGLRLKSTKLVRNGVNTSHFSPRDRAEARARLGVASNSRVALCVGRLVKQKGQRDLLTAWRGIAAADASALLVLVGDGPDRPALQEMTRDFQVRVVTDCSDPRDWYAAADVVVTPSQWEGAALVPLEALAMQRTLVGYDVGDLGYVVGPHGKAVPRGERSLLLKELGSVIADPALQAARERGAAKYVRMRYEAAERLDDVTRLYTTIARKGV